VSKLSDRHRRFAELVVSGRPAGRAYEEAGYASRGPNADAEASKLQKREDVAAYIESLREDAAAAAAMSRDSLLKFLSAAVETPIIDVDPSHPLCQEHHIQHGKEGEGNTVKIKSVDKLRAAQILVGMMGWNKPVKVEGNLTLARVLEEIKPTGLPGNEPADADDD
jgi:phage terminase small subunit